MPEYRVIQRLREFAPSNIKNSSDYRQAFYFGVWFLSTFASLALTIAFMAPLASVPIAFYAPLTLVGFTLTLPACLLVISSIGFFLEKKTPGIFKLFASALSIFKSTKASPATVDDDDLEFDRTTNTTYTAAKPLTVLYESLRGRSTTAMHDNGMESAKVLDPNEPPNYGSYTYKQMRDIL